MTDDDFLQLKLQAVVFFFVSIDTRLHNKQAIEFLCLK